MTEDPGLDLTRLRALRGTQRDHSHILNRIAAHLEERDGYLALSGGKDSVTVAHLARQVDPAIPMAWFDSGIEWPETRAYLARLREDWNLNLTAIRSSPTALEAMAASGRWHLDRPDRPAPRLSEICIDAPSRTAHDHFGPGELWGVRAAESTGRRITYATALTREVELSCTGTCTTGRDRAANHGGLIRRDDGTTAYGPIWDWSTSDVWEYLHAHDIPTNPIYDKLRRLGAPAGAQRVALVIDGARLEQGSALWLKTGWPDLYAELVEQLPLLADYA